MNFTLIKTKNRHCQSTATISNSTIVKCLEGKCIQLEPYKEMLKVIAILMQNIYRVIGKRWAES